MVPFLLALFALASSTPWFAVYNLTNEQIQNLTEAGCYRGLYGGTYTQGAPRTLSLTTCGSGAPLVELPDDATLCVVELFSPTMVGAAQEIVMRSSAGKLLFVGEQELVIAASSGSLPSDLCCVVDFPGLAASVPIVPDRPIRSQLNYELEHPATIKYLLNKNESLRTANPIVTAMVAAVSTDNLQAQLRRLATDSSGGNTKITRNSYSLPSSCSSGFTCIMDAIQYVTTTVRSLYADRSDVTIEQRTFQSNMGPNTVVVVPGETVDRVIFSAHIDSRNNVNTNTGNPAPGGDDNGSGSALLLEFVRIFSAYRFHYTVEFHWYAGEEQGLLGSKALANAYKGSSAFKVIAVFNADMIGYTASQYGIVLTFENASSTLSLTTACRNIVTTYMPELKQGVTNGCCSDYQSWYNAGFAATGIFETPATNVLYPQYHTANDVYTNVNPVQLYQFTQALISCAGEYAIPLGKAL